MLRIVFRAGTWAEYRGLARFHYVRGRPATVAGVWVAEHVPGVMMRGLGEVREVAGAVVWSWCGAWCRERDRVFGMEGWGLGERLARLNGEFRVVSRLVVHPRYRGLGVGVGLLRAARGACGVRYLEARARMGHGALVFDRAGFRRVEGGLGRPVYFWSEGLCGGAESSAFGATVEEGAGGVGGGAEVVAAVSAEVSGEEVGVGGGPVVEA